MKKSILSRNESAMKMVAHRIKPNLHILGLNEIAEIAASIEIMENVSEIKEAMAFVMVNLPIINNQIQELRAKYEVLNTN